jgi:hypothetical protein
MAPRYDQHQMTTGDFKRWLIENEVSDDTPMWKLGTVIEHGCEYPDDYGMSIESATLHTNTYGIALPKDKQKTEVGVALW